MAELLLVLRFVMAGLLYVFLGLVVYLIIRDLRERAREETHPYLPATLAAESDTVPEQRFTLRPVTAIGRAKDNHLVIDDPFTSANHAIVAWREDRWWIEDLNSHNGTYLNGERIRKPQTLVAGDRIGIGQSQFRFELEASATS